MEVFALWVFTLKPFAEPLCRVESKILVLGFLPYRYHCKAQGEGGCAINPKHFHNAISNFPGKLEHFFGKFVHIFGKLVHSFGEGGVP